MPYLCPACKSELQWGGHAIYQTMDEHISSPNHEPPYRSFYYCNNTKCGANAPEENRVVTRKVLTEKLILTEPDSIAVFWDMYGDLYGNPFNVKFIDNNHGPFGSESRRMNVEIYKKDENKTIGELFGIRIDAEYRYKSDTNGKIISRTKDYRLWKKSNLGYTHINYPFSFSKFRFYNRRFYNNIGTYHSIFSGNILNGIFRPKNINISSVLFSMYVNLLYPIVSFRLRDEKYQDK
jgi:hypothetical protein